MKGAWQGRAGGVFAVVGLSVLGLASGPALAQELSQLSCRALWYQRNAVYAEQGHCFKTADAIATFGERCYPPYGKLTRSQQAYVNEVMAWERRKGCR